MMFGASLFKTALNLTTGLMNISRMHEGYRVRSLIFNLDCNIKDPAL
jgi:hypothetical protein